MTWSGLLAFLLASFVLAMVPGVGTAMLVKQSVRGGRRGALATVAGMEVGVAVWAVAAGLGLSMLLFASRVAYEVLRVVGVCVLLWFGVRALFGRHRPAVDATGPTAGSGFRAGLRPAHQDPALAAPPGDPPPARAHQRRRADRARHPARPGLLVESPG